MDKHEYRVKTEQMISYMKNKDYKEAMDIADVIDWNKVKNVSMLCTVSELYEMNKEYQKSRDILFLAYDRSPESKKIVYRLSILALKLGDVKEAMDCYEEFVAIAPKDPNQYVLKYKILRCQKAPLEEQIQVLETFKKVEYVEKWAYELAMLYQSAGMLKECIEECDDLILWFSEGKYVYKAMDLKKQYRPLTPLQQEKYNLRFAAPTQKPAEEDNQEEVKEEPQKQEELVEEVMVKEEVVAKEEGAPKEEVVLEEKEEKEEQKAEEPVATEEFMEEKKETTPLSIEEMLQEWEEKQKENAELIRAEYEKVEAEKVQEEKEEKEEAEETEDILSKDIRKLMEELETESADIESQKVKQEEEPAEEKTLIQKVADQLANLDIKEVLTPSASVGEKTVDVIGKAETVAEGFVDVPEVSVQVEKKESGELKLGDTQSMAAVAKALKNDVEVTFPEEEEDDFEEEKSPFDTGFIVKGRYDLEAQSEIGLKAGLTEEQKKLFSYFVPVHGMSEQLVEVLQNDKRCKSRYGTSRIGNILIIGRKGSGKTVLAVDVVKAIQKGRKVKPGKVGIVTADVLNKKNAAEIMKKLYGGALIIEKASKLSRQTIETMCEVMEGQTGELLVVLEDQRKPIEKMLTLYPQFEKKFTSRLELPVFINDELVTFGQTYAKENGYKIDEMGILALYSRIDMLQREEKVVTVADVKEIIDDAIENSHKASFKKLVKKFVGKHTDDSDRIILREEDFK